jgi:3-carboxy-cis,cis-muconate cycloisomerase
VSDPARLLEQGWEDGTPVLPLLEEIRSRLPEKHAGHLHMGSTTQDVVDTALMLQARSALELLDASLASASISLAGLADAHRATAALGRTFLQAAVATSFGTRAARWLQSVVHVRGDIRRLQGRLPLQLGGPVGDTASFGDAACALTERVADHIGLAVPAAPWHTDRWPVQDIASLLGKSASVCSKIASDVAFLAAAGDVRVRSGRSSSMSHKRNPVDAMRAEAASQVCRAVVAGLMTSPAHLLERGMGPWHAEWALVPLAFQTAGAGAEAIARCLETLEVDVDVMTAAAGGETPVDTGLIDRALAAHQQLEG